MKGKTIYYAEGPQDVHFNNAMWQIQTPFKYCSWLCLIILKLILTQTGNEQQQVKKKANL